MLTDLLRLIEVDPKPPAFGQSLLNFSLYAEVIIAAETGCITMILDKPQEYISVMCEAQQILLDGEAEGGLGDRFWQAVWDRLQLDQRYYSDLYPIHIASAMVEVMSS
jgi:hypothetical protein